MIVTDYQSLSVTENLHFKSFVTKLNATHKLPSKEALADKLIPNYFNEVHSQLVEELKNTKFISLTMEILHLKDKEKFVSINGHCVQNYDVYPKNLASRNITQQNTKEIFSIVLDEYQISEKIVVIALSSL